MAEQVHVDAVGVEQADHGGVDVDRFAGDDVGDVGDRNVDWFSVGTFDDQGLSVAPDPAIASDAVNIALARRWPELWKVGDNILPLAFRSGFTSEIDAVLCLLLDIATGSAIGLPAFGRHNALIRLGMADDGLEDFRDAILRPALEELVADLPAGEILERLRVRTEKSGRKRPRRANDETTREGELDLLRARPG